MDRLILKSLILIFSIFFVSCSPIICNKPYILVGTECCLDQNDNYICDNDETKTADDEDIEPIQNTLVTNAPVQNEIYESFEDVAKNPSDYVGKQFKSKVRYYWVWTSLFDLDNEYYMHIDMSSSCTSTRRAYDEGGEYIFEGTVVYNPQTASDEYRYTIRCTQPLS